MQTATEALPEGRECAEGDADCRAGQNERLRQIIKELQRHRMTNPSPIDPLVADSEKIDC
jgi:hypothetical protein